MYQSRKPIHPNHTITVTNSTLIVIYAIGVLVGTYCFLQLIHHTNGIFVIVLGIVGYLIYNNLK